MAKAGIVVECMCMCELHFLPVGIAAGQRPPNGGRISKKGVVTPEGAWFLQKGVMPTPTGGYANYKRGCNLHSWLKLGKGLGKALPISLELPSLFGALAAAICFSVFG